MATSPQVTPDDREAQATCKREQDANTGLDPRALEQPARPLQLAGYHGAEHSSRIRLYKSSDRSGDYFEVALCDIVRLFQDDDPDARDGRTVVELRPEAPVLMCIWTHAGSFADRDRIPLPVRRWPRR